MGAELIRKYVTSSMIVCYRSVVRHPFLVGMIVFLFSMYRLFPLLFSIVVSASPVLVSTAILLGTLLSFGQPNIPEIEKESESERADVQKLETMVISHTEIVGSEETNGSRNEVADKSFEDLSKIDDDDSCVEADKSVNLFDDGLLQFGDVKSEADEEKLVLGSHYSPLQEDDHIVLENDRLWEGSADPLNSNSGLLWKGMERSGDDDDDEDDYDDDDGDVDDDDGSDSGDSGSDVAESSSPDASMVDILPMLDELHPLLSEEQETHQPSHTLHDGTDAVSQHSLESSDTSSESGDDTGIENHENLKTRDDEDEDKELEHIVKEDDTRSAITWTEDDQKNLMDLGTSEMERNRRLENLIARRRARKTMRLQAEKNLIDLESADLPWNIPPISTSRNNPFDYDSNDNIPGSAPSVLLQRKNPFDLPYDSSEEKPDLVGDTFQQEFAVFQPKEPFFRRHESFNVGPSIFAASRSERQETKLKPYFVPERSFSSFQRQFSGLSDSKVSSVPDTESVSSDLENKDHIEEDELVSDLENKDHIEEDEHVSHQRPYFVPEHVASDKTRFPSFQRQLSEVSDSKVSSEADTESVSSDNDLENKDHIDLSQEPDLISVEDNEHASEIIEHVSGHVSLVSESFEEDENVDPRGLDEAEISVGSVTHQQELRSNGSSLSSSDEASEQIYNDKEGDEVVTGSVLETNYFLDRNSSIERSETGVTSLLVEESLQNEPVYDLSPRSVTRNLSSSSIVIDLHKDESSQLTDDHNQHPVVPDIEEHVLAVDDMLTSVPYKPVFEVEDVLVDLGASHELEQVQDSLLTSQARSYENFHQEDVTPQPDEKIQAHDLEHDEVTLPSNEAQVTEVEHGQTHESYSPTHEKDTSQLQKELSLIDTFVNESPSEENPEVLQVQITSNNSDNLQIQEPDVVEVNDLEIKAQGIPTYASDTQSIEGNIDDADEIDEDLLVELDAVGDFSVNDFGSTLKEMKEGPHTSERDPENKGIADENAYKNDLESNMSEMKQYLHVSEHTLETSQSLDEDSYSKVLGSTLDEMKLDSHASDYDLENKAQEISAYASDTQSIEGNVDDVDGIDEVVELDAVGDFSVNYVGSTLNEMKEGPHTSEHDRENKGIADEDSSNNDLKSNLSKIKQYVSEYDLETSHSIDEDSFSKDLGTTYEMKLKYDIESKCSGDEVTTLDERKREPFVLDHNLETMVSGDSHAFDHDLETKHAEDEDSYSNVATLDEIKQDPHDMNRDPETKHSEDEYSYAKDTTLDEMKQGSHESNHDLGTKHAEDEDSYSKDTALKEMKLGSHDSNHDLETKHSEDQDSYNKDATLDEMKQGPHDLETDRSEDEDSYSKDATLDELKQDPHDPNRDIETNHIVDEDSYSKDLDTTFNEMKGVHALEHRLETFYSVDENFYSKHVESTLNEIKQDLKASDQGLESGETKFTTDAEVMRLQNDDYISNTKVEDAFQAEASNSKLTSDASESVLPQEAKSTSSLASSTSTTMVSHETDKE